MGVLASQSRHGRPANHKAKRQCWGPCIQAGVGLCLICTKKQLVPQVPQVGSAEGRKPSASLTVGDWGIARCGEGGRATTGDCAWARRATPAVQTVARQQGPRTWRARVRVDSQQPGWCAGMHAHGGGCKPGLGRPRSRKGYQAARQPRKEAATQVHKSTHRRAYKARQPLSSLARRCRGSGLHARQEGELGSWPCGGVGRTAQRGAARGAPGEGKSSPAQNGP